jgi:hypothetical protein
MLLLDGEYNFFKPKFWNVGAGFNMKLINQYFQNDFMLGFGGIRVEEIITGEPQGEERQKFIFSIKDSFYFSLDGKWIGLRVGVFASIGIYDVPDFKKRCDMFFNAGGFAGICILPRSLVSVTVDLRPGYAIAFRIGEERSINEAGFSLSPSVGIRFNFDKL